MTTYDATYDLSDELRSSLDEATAQRDLARDVAVQLEQQVAAVRALHQPLQGDSFRTCGQCISFWPCETVRILDGDES